MEICGGLLAVLFSVNCVEECLCETPDYVPAVEGQGKNPVVVCKGVMIMCTFVLKESVLLIEDAIHDVVAGCYCVGVVNSMNKTCVGPIVSLTWCNFVL